jgi:hypothetical protein
MTMVFVGRALPLDPDEIKIRFHGAGPLTLFALTQKSKQKKSRLRPLSGVEVRTLSSQDANHCVSTSALQILNS